MAITQSVVKIYSDAALTSLVDTITTSGSSTVATATGLSAGTAYWATVTISETGGSQTAESEAYKFYTLCNVNFNTGSPTGGNGSISAELTVTTTDVVPRIIGIEYDTHSDFSDLRYTEEAFGVSRALVASNLQQNTTYYVRPYVIDEFGRKWTNTAAAVSIVTGFGVPVVNWTGVSALGSTTYSTSVNITSSSPLTSVVAYYQAAGGSVQTVNLQNQTGTQIVSLTGLASGTQYTLYVRATNTAGYGDSIIRNFTTDPAAVSVEVSNVSVDNATNIINVDSKAEYDSSIITITGHWVDLYENDEHRGTAFESVSGGANAVVNLNLSHANPDETYFVFGRVTYTVAGDATEYTAWSDPWETLTYSLFSFGARGTDGTTAKFEFSVVGDAQSTAIEYSADQANWTMVAVGDPNGETIILNGLDPDTTYYFKGRTKSAAGWSGYDTMTLTTGADTAHQIVITSVTNITSDSAIINVTIS